MQNSKLKFAIPAVAWGTFCVAVLGGAYLAPLALAQEGGEPKHSIKEVMKAAHNKESGVLGKVLSGEATQEEKIVLLDHYISLSQNKPPKGDAESWNKLTGAIVMAASKVVVGREGAEAELKTATTCAACHKEHKP